MASGKKFKVIICMDKTDESENSLRYYLDKMYSPEHEVLIVHAIEIGDHSSARDAYLSACELSDEYSEELERAKKMENKFMMIFKSYGITAVRVRIEGARKAGHVITQVAREEEADLVITGSRGRGPVMRAILGSTSDYVMNNCECGVLVCRK